MAIDVGTAVAYLDLNMTAFNTGLQSAQSALKTFRDDASTLGDKVMGAGSVISNVGASITRNLSVPIANFGVGSIQAYRDFESAFAGVKKTIDDSRFKEYSVTWDDLSNAIKQMAEETGISAEEIAGVMEVAGQLGVELGDSGKGIIDFTRQMVLMGVTTDMTAKDAALNLARFMNITGTTNDEVGNLTASIVDLGNNFATQEQEIVSMSTRLASAGTMAGLTSQEILALSTAMTSAGIKAEAGASSMSTVLSNLTSRVIKYGKVLDGSFEGTPEEAGKIVAAMETIADVSDTTAEDFYKIWSTKPIEGLTMLIKGMATAEERGDNAILQLDELGFTSIRQSNMLRALSLSFENMSDAVNTSNIAWGEATAMEVEAAKRFETLDSRISMLQERWKDVKREIAEMLLPLLERIIDKVKDLLNWWDNLDQHTKDLILKIGEFIVVAGPIVGIVGGIVSGVGELIGIIEVIKGIGILKKVEKVNEVLKIGNLILGDVIDNSEVSNLAIGQLAGAFDLSANSANIFSNNVGVASTNTAILSDGVGIAGGALTNMGGAASGAADDVGKVGGKIAETGSKANESVPHVNKFTEALKKIGGFALIAGGVVLAFGTIKDAVENGCTAIHVAVLALAGAITGIGVALMLGWNVWITGAVGLAVGALAGLAILIYQHWDEIKAKFKEFGEAVGRIWKNITDLLKSLWEGACSAVKWVWDHTIGFLIDLAKKLKHRFFGDPIIVEIADGIVKWFGFMADMMGKLFQAGVDAVIAIATFLKDTIGGLIKAAVDIIVGAFTTMKDGIVSIVENVKEKVAEFAGKVKEGFDHAKEVAIDFFKDMIGKIGEWKDKWIARAKEAAQGFVNGFKEKTGNAAEFFKNFFRNALDLIKSKASDFLSAGQQLAGRFAEGFKNAWGSLKDWVSGAVSGISSLVGGVVDKIKSVGSTVSQNVKKVVNGKHKDGLDYVPFDGYVAELHKGERVLTAKENAQYSGGIGGSTINFYSNEKIDEYTAARELKRAVKDINLGLV